MKAKLYDDGSMFIHIEDNDEYEVEDDNGVSIFLSKEQAKLIADMVRP